MAAVIRILKKLFGLLFFSLCGVLFMLSGWVLIRSTHEDNESVAAFYRTGQTAIGHVSGYEYVEEHGRGAHSGDRAVIAFTDSDGKLIHFRADQLGHVLDEYKRDLERRDIRVTYQPSNPTVARVHDWESNAGGSGYFSGGSVMVVGGLFIYVVITNLRPRHDRT